MIALFLGVLVCVPLWGQNLNFAPDKPDGPAKIQSALWELATPRAAKSVRDVQDTVVVILVPQFGQASASIDTSSLAALGGRVLAQSKSLMRISVPASSLLAVSELPGVGFVRRPYRPHSQRTISEGTARIGALANHSAGVKGQGVKVAIIDGGFKGANKLRGDLPARWRYLDYTGEGIYAGESAHGTACAEIVHDIAPDAELTFLKTGDLVDFENAKDFCIREGIDIISYSNSRSGTGFGDGRGLACDIVNDAADNGILWVNSAGNYAESHYSGFWSNYDSDGWHNFDGEYEMLAFEAEEGDSISVVLTWNDFPITSQDYDLFIYYNDDVGNLERVAESTDIQSRNAPNRPAEWIEYEAQESGRYGIAVRKEDSARPMRLKIWSFDHDFEEYAVSANSITSPADARGAMSVGAVHYWDYNRGRIADYSSRGPTTDGRIKPDIVAPSGVATASYGPDGFFGTSAAAPHVAGAAALLKSANPSYSRTQLWNALVAATVDIGTRGRDNDSGYGKLVLPVSGGSDTARLTITSPWISSVSPQPVKTNAVVTVLGGNFGSSRRSSSVRIGSVAIPSSSFTSWSNSTIRFRIPLNTLPGNLTVRTSEGTSNAVRLQTTSPYLTGIAPTQVKTRGRLTLTGGNFGTRRGTGYVLFTSNVRPAAADYVSWSDRRIVVRVPSQARSGNVQVVTSNGRSGTKLLLLGTAPSRAPQISSVSPRRVRYNQLVTIRGRAFGANRGTSKVIFYDRKEPISSHYVSWSDTRIQVRVPTGGRTGNMQVITTRGSASARLTITSPWVRNISPQIAKTNTVVAVNGENFGSSRRSSSVRIGSVVVSSFTSWSSKVIRFRIPLNTPPGNLTVRTSEGPSNAVRLETTSPYLTRISPTQAKTGDRLTLTGGNFGTRRGTGYILFGSNVRPAAADYVSWSDRRVVVEVPARAQSGNVRVTTSNGTSGTKRLEIESEQLEPLPSRGLFGYSPPTVTKNPKSVKFGFEGIGEDVALGWSLKNDSEVDILVNGQRIWRIPVSDDWKVWGGILSQTHLNSGQNVIEFRNRVNQNRTASFTHWQLKDVKWWKPANAKLAAGTWLLSKLPDGLGDPFPTPFNAEVTIPFALAEAGPVRLVVYNLLGQSIRVLADGWLAAGTHRVRWDGRTAAGAEAASGIYWAVLQADDAIQTAKLALIR